MTYGTVHLGSVKSDKLLHTTSSDVLLFFCYLRCWLGFPSQIPLLPPHRQFTVPYINMVSTLLFSQYLTIIFDTQSKLVRRSLNNLVSI